ncbi:MAG: tetratricopeptide repeat protein [Planctomycetia bacterium]|nr:MAG: tetratricopeptide repeat protein [Planctomycetia bacterium]
MAKKKINKNLVAFLTVMGILLSVTIVAVITVQGSQKDPVKTAEIAAQHENSGDMERAIEYYLRAYEASRRKGEPDVKYYLEASRCAYTMGNLGLSLNLLSRANTQAPADKSVLTAIVERLWELRKLGYEMNNDARDSAEKLINLAPDDILANLTSAVSLQALSATDPSLRTLAEERMKKVVELAPDDPRVVAARAGKLMFDAAQIVRGATGRPSRDDENRFNALREEALRVVEAGIAKNPGSAELVSEYAQMLVNLDRMDDAVKVIEDGVKAAPANAEMHANLGRFLTMYIAISEARGRKLTQAQRSEMLARAEAGSQKARELEPAMHEVYSDLARAKLLDRDPDADSDAAAAERYRAAIEVYEDGIKSTVGQKSVRALTAQRGRLGLLTMAFDSAREMLRIAPDDAGRKWAEEKCRKFAAEVKSQFGEEAISFTLQAQVAQIDRDPRRAIQMYIEAERASRNVTALNRDANVNLALLYHSIGELGAAAKYLKAAQALYDRDRGEPPLELRIIEADLLLRNNEAQRALDLTDNLLQREQYRNDPRLQRVRAAVLAAMGRTAEASQIAAGASDDDVDNILLRARLAVVQQDLDTASSAFEEALSQEPERSDAVRQYVALMIGGNRQEAARAFLTKAASKVRDADVQRLYAGLDILLSTPDPEERNRKLLEAIEKIPDEVTRNVELTAYYTSLNQFDKAAAALDQVEKARPQDRAVLEQQLGLALNRKAFDRAGQYVTKLANINADGAGGATYRGQLALARGDAATAVREFRAALQKLPGDSRLLVLLAAAQMDSSPRDAIASLTEAVASNPRSLPALKMLHELHSRQGERDLARGYLERAVTIGPRDPYVQKHAESLAEEQDPQAGIARREELRRQTPDDVDNLLRLCELYMRIENRQRAVEVVNAAQALKPDSLDVVQLACALYRSEADRPEGERVVRGFINAVKEETKVFGHILLARYYMLIGAQSDAIALLESLPRLCDELISDSAVRHMWLLESATELAERYADTRNPDLAVDAMKKAVAMLRPEDRPDTRQRIRGRLLELMARSPKHVTQIEPDLAAYLKDYPRDFRGLQVKAQMQIARGEFEPARSTLNDLMLLRPGDALTLSTRGLVNNRLKLYAQALKDLQEARALTTPVPPQQMSELGRVVRLRLATLYEQDDNQIELAIATHREIVDGPPINHAAAANLIRLYKLYRKPEDADKLIAEYEQREPADPFWPMQLGRLQLDRNAPAAAALQFQRAFDLSKKSDRSALSNLIYSRAKAGQGADAVRLFESAAPELLSAGVRIAGAWAYDAVRDTAKANAALEDAVLDSAQKGLADLIQTAQIAAELRPWTEIAAICGKVQAAPGAQSQEIATRLRTVRALAMINTPDAGAVPEVLAPIIRDTQPGSDEWIRAKLVTAQGYMTTKNNVAAVSAYEDILRYVPGHVESLNNLAYFKAEGGDLAEAEKYAERLASMEVNDPNVLDTIGYVYAKKGRNRDAETWYREALRLDAQNLPARLHLGELLASEGKADDARSTLERAIRDADKQGDAQSKRAAEELLRKIGR